MKQLSWTWLLLAAALTACGTSASPIDRPADAGTATDTGDKDAGSVPPDAGPADTGARDGGADADSGPVDGGPGGGDGGVEPGPGIGYGEPCMRPANPKDDPCEEGTFCRGLPTQSSANGFCTSLCLDNGDCSLVSGFVCAREVEYCIPDPAPAKTCKFDGDCPQGQVCGVYQEPSGAALIQTCGEPSGSAKPGYACDDSTADKCPLGICVDNVCTTTCRGDEHCQFGSQPMSCQVVETALLPGGKEVESAALCFPFPGSKKPCAKNRDCPADEACAGYWPSGGKPGGACRKPHGNKQAGEPCDPEASSPGCATGICLDDETCSAFCESDADCTGGTQCLDQRPDADYGLCVLE